MPVMDGFQVLEEKQKDASIRDIPVIVISSRDPNENLIMSNSLRIIHNSGLTISNLADCIQAVSQILAPSNTAEQHGGENAP
jgi:CheY-like chemotaxis protein